jgi:hypothetical protein
MFNELLVLGRIPGTNFQITFTEYIAVMCLLILAMVWHRNPRLIRYGLAKIEFWLAAYALRFKRPVI